MRPKPLKLTQLQLVMIAVVASLIGIVAWQVVPDVGDTPEIGDKWRSALAAREAGEYKRAIELLGRIDASNPRHVDALYLRAECYRALGQDEPMIVDAKAVLALDARHIKALEMLAEHFRTHGDRDRAVAYAERLAKIDADNAVAARVLGEKTP